MTSSLPAPYLLMPLHPLPSITVAQGPVCFFLVTNLSLLHWCHPSHIFTAHPVIICSLPLPPRLFFLILSLLAFKVYSFFSVQQPTSRLLCLALTMHAFELASPCDCLLKVKKERELFCLFQRWRGF